jgi:PEGA domain
MCALQAELLHLRLEFVLGKLKACQATRSWNTIATSKANLPEVSDMRYVLRVLYLVAIAGFLGSFLFENAAYSQDQIMGKVRFFPSSKDIKRSGVWIDGQYVGFLGELKGANRLRLLPGDHDIKIRQAGYADLNRKVVIEPRTTLDFTVNMDKDPRFYYPDGKTGCLVRFAVVPGRAAVFMDDYYIGTVEQYYGIRNAMLVVPGKHRFKIALAGYKTFETDVDLAPGQKFELRTELMGGSIKDADPSIRSESASAASSVSQARPSDVR